MINNHTISFPFSAADLQMRVAYNGNYPEYIALARPGAQETAPEWQIRKLVYDAYGNITSITFAGGSNDYNKVYQDRADYAYS
jgi:YD repeat-containing protein